MRFLLDHHVDPAIAYQLRRNEVDCVTAFELRMADATDSTLFDLCISEEMHLVTADVDFETLAASALRIGRDFPAIIKLRNPRIGIGIVISHLLLINGALPPSELRTQIIRVPF